MPNWCHNEITVEGEKEYVKEFMDFVKSDKQEFDFNEIVPMPKNIFEGDLSSEEREKYGSLNLINTWYVWCRENWSTSWNTCSVEKKFNPLTTWNAYNVTKSVDPDFRKVKYTFDTACSEPSNILKVLKKKFDLGYSKGDKRNIFWFYREDVQQFCGYLHNEV